MKIRVNEENNRKIEETIAKGDECGDWMNDNPVMESVSEEEVEYITE